MLRDLEKNSTIWSAALDKLDNQKRLFTDAHPFEYLARSTVLL